MSEQSVNIVVNYAFQRLGASELPEKERWGFGRMVMNAERFPVTEEERIEVGRTIGLEAGYEAVAVQYISRLDKLIEDGDIVLEGTIVDEDS